MNIITATRLLIFCLMPSLKLLDFTLLHRHEPHEFLTGSLAVCSHIYDADSLRRCQNTRLCTSFSRTALCVCGCVCACTCACEWASEREQARERQREKWTGEWRKSVRELKLQGKGSVKILIWDKNTLLLIFEQSHTHTRTATQWKKKKNILFLSLHKSQLVKRGPCALLKTEN